jgi:hypothetical protein
MTVKKKRGRPLKVGPKRDRNMLVKLTKAEKERIWAKSTEHGMTLSQFVRTCVRDVCDNGLTRPVQKL